MDKIDSRTAAHKLVKSVEDSSKVYNGGNINYAYCVGAFSALVEIMCDKISDKDLAELVRVHGSK